MAAPAIAFYASPPSSVCSTPYSSTITSHSSCDFDLNGPSSSPVSSSPSTSQRQTTGGLSCLFSSRSHRLVKHPSPSPYSAEDFGALWQERTDEYNNFSSSLRFSTRASLSPSLKKRDHSPVSVLQGSVASSNGLIGSSRSPPTRFSWEKADGSFRISTTTGLLNGFVPGNTLGSCLDFDSTSFRMHSCSLDTDSSSGLAEELTFAMEDGFLVMEEVLQPHVKELLVDAQLRHKIFCEEIVLRAFYEAEKAHRGQMRASGDPYLQHCVETAVMLAMIGANSTVVAAGLLHDTVDDCCVSYDHLCNLFGSGVADLVQGVSKLSHLSKLARDNDTACKIAEANRLHTMFLAMADTRAVLIKLADRLHNMMTLEALPLAKQVRFAKETLEIFVPLANRLGISTWKDQLQNLCFKHLNPDKYKEISSKLAKYYDEAMITAASEKLEGVLKHEGISFCALLGRNKSLYSIHCKMMKKNLSIEEVHDIHGLRLIVENEEDCSRALQAVHQLWSEVPGKLKDYIHQPKFNGYRSIHTVVMGEGMVPLEVQIRTKAMHLQAEYGIAAHWRYKEGDSEYSSFVVQMVEWARWILTWQCKAIRKDLTRLPCSFPSHSKDCPYLCKPHSEAQDGPVFIILIENNNKMSVRELSANSTLMELFEKVGYGSSPRCGSSSSSNSSEYGFPAKEDLRPRVNKKPVIDQNCKLKMGDVVELSPALPDDSLPEYREEIQRMYEKGFGLSSMSPSLSGRA